MPSGLFMPFFILSTKSSSLIVADADDWKDMVDEDEDVDNRLQVDFTLPSSMARSN